MGRSESEDEVAEGDAEEGEEIMMDVPAGEEGEEKPAPPAFGLWRKTADGRVFVQYPGGKFEEQRCPWRKGVSWGYQKTVTEIARRAKEKDVVRCLIVDIIVKAHQNGQGVLGELLLSLSVAVRCWTSAHGYDVLAALDLVYARGTVDAVRDEMVKGHEAGFTAALQELAQEGFKVRGYSSFSAQVDNYCKGRMNRKLMSQLFGTNFRILNTQSRMLGAPLHPQLSGNGGYGVPLDDDRLKAVVARVGELAKLAKEPGATKHSLAFRLRVLESTRQPDREPWSPDVAVWHEGIRDLPVDVEWDNKDRPYAVSKHLVAPQVTPPHLPPQSVGISCI